ncbi:MAG: hypothetical protein CGU28_11195 [Candidatus Dactylopiibacterium carminicum]|uniref:DUF192 domain-containing protein n=1 Tax=Candidatus Dactylopiibacterium carminicum TaxID=857335 RepID=A0A272ESX3_9RHOO|nr:DUF192 domain-containing protein [Candidatus Dactylopiibacterium carminicum]KAF7600778.1 hypothetical protein BGI27_01305 [Candidatus Dactylopiibacterium carminicum]PAS93202.1 MAG: hypothetical protein CGU29_08555 [Candidatus Dactylopiibacterium carminicum]PAS95882.1 MAG: hypothetical protein CGU28_11195 [Candidatus Dactylopiibacterium carminicum]PAT00784.1 MAG: hypothetical protein BSR46_01320 [Candidatus Dactylopiibacterium carminicum]
MRVLLSCLLLWFSSLVQAQAGLPVTELGIGMFRVQAEVADTQGSRARGLMYRRTLPAHTGMLFVFEQPAEQCFWMKNTLLPLSIAFIDDAGHIVNVEDMQPMTETSHCSAKPVRYALEMNQGWFQSKGFGPGTPVRGIVR